MFHSSTPSPIACPPPLLQLEDVGALKWQNAELGSRNEIYQTQLEKAQKALERSSEDKAQLETDLAAALAASTSGDKLVGHTPLPHPDTIIGSNKDTP